MARLLLDLAHNGSFAEFKASFLLSSSSTDGLQEQGWIVEVAPDFFMIGAGASAFLTPVGIYHKPVRLPLYTGCTASNLTDASKMSVVELLQQLAGAGWHDEECAQKQAASKPPYTGTAGGSGDAGKIWYRVKGRVPFKSYLLALLQAEKVLQKVTAVHHGQLDTCPG